MPSGILNQLRGAVKPHGQTVQHCAQEGGRFVGFKPGRHINQQRKTCRMRFRKSIFAKAFYLTKDPFSKFDGITTAGHSIDYFLMEGAEPPLLFPGSHGAPQLICFARGEAGSKYCQLHYLFLENWYAQGALQGRFHFFAWVNNVFQSLSAAQIRMHHVSLNRSWTDDGDFYDQIVESPWFQARQHGHLSAGFDLEDANSVGLADHVERCLIFCRNILHPEWRATPGGNQVERAADGR